MTIPRWKSQLDTGDASDERGETENPLVDFLLAKPLVAPCPGLHRIVYGKGSH